ncbi:MAG TPA: RodZ domain-containing protein [Gaiellaceae bacterium]|nr:RodZ domain-containing protein [Gaiellaceae bacterium]
MFEIGASLREARLRRGLSPGDVQQAIRIRERYLAAIEEERWEMLPGEAYAKGFLRTYAEYLGLDGDLYLDEWNSRFAQHEEAPAVEPVPAARRRRELLRPAAVVIAVAIVAAAAAAWMLGSSGRTRHPTSASAPPVTTRAAPAKPPPARPAPAPAFAVFRAVRGRCWLLVRAATATGPVIYEHVLEQGASLRLRVGSGLWVRMGAPWNLELTVAGHPAAGLPTAPGNVLVSTTGIAPA